MAHLSKAKLKLFASLHQKKYRYQHRLFLAEGRKLVSELLRSGLKVEAVVLREGGEEIDGEHELYWAKDADFERLSTQVSPEGVLAIVHFPQGDQLQERNAWEQAPTGPGFMLDDIRDPGNLGTLLRTADWFGFERVLCSKACVDPFHPKVVRASMGALFRVKLVLVEDFGKTVMAQAEHVWVADMDGENAAAVDLGKRPWLLIGNEANGVRAEIRENPGLRRISIPRFGEGESLNAGVSGAILAALWRIK